MGSIKKQVTQQASEHTLTEEEFNYVMNVNKAKQEIADQYNRVMSAFLNYIAKSRLGYKSANALQFELDFNDNKRNLKVSILPTEQE